MRSGAGNGIAGRSASFGTERAHSLNQMAQSVAQASNNFAAQMAQIGRALPSISNIITADKFGAQHEMQQTGEVASEWLARKDANAKRMFAVQQKANIERIADNIRNAINDGKYLSVTEYDNAVKNEFEKEIDQTCEDTIKNTGVVYDPDRLAPELSQIGEYLKKDFLAKSREAFLVYDRNRQQKAALKDMADAAYRGDFEGIDTAFDTGTLCHIDIEELTALRDAAYVQACGNIASKAAIGESLGSTDYMEVIEKWTQNTISAFGEPVRKDLLEMATAAKDLSPESQQRIAEALQKEEQSRIARQKKVLDGITTARGADLKEIIKIVPSGRDGRLAIKDFIEQKIHERFDANIEIAKATAQERGFSAEQTQQTIDAINKQRQETIISANTDLNSHLHSIEASQLQTNRSIFNGIADNPQRGILMIADYLKNGTVENTEAINHFLNVSARKPRDNAEFEAESKMWVLRAASRIKELNDQNDNDGNARLSFIVQASADCNNEDLQTIARMFTFGANGASAADKELAIKALMDASGCKISDLKDGNKWRLKDPTGQEARVFSAVSEIVNAAANDKNALDIILNKTMPEIKARKGEEEALNLLNSVNQQIHLRIQMLGDAYIEEMKQRDNAAALARTQAEEYARAKALAESLPPEHVDPVKKARSESVKSIHANAPGGRILL